MPARRCLPRRARFGKTSVCNGCPPERERPPPPDVSPRPPKIHPVRAQNTHPRTRKKSLLDRNSAVLCANPPVLARFRHRETGLASRIRVPEPRFSSPIAIFPCPMAGFCDGTRPCVSPFFAPGEATVLHSLQYPSTNGEYHVSQSPLRRTRLLAPAGTNAARLGEQPVPELPPSRRRTRPSLPTHLAVFVLRSCDQLSSDSGMTAADSIAPTAPPDATASKPIRKARTIMSATSRFHGERLCFVLHRDCARPVSGSQPDSATYNPSPRLNTHSTGRSRVVLRFQQAGTWKPKQPSTG
jgi:hypothetical protein